MNRYFKLLLALAALLSQTILLTGCATKSFPTPEVIGSDGLAIGQVLTVDYLRGVNTPVINGKPYTEALSQGYFLIALKPGQYSLDSFVGSAFDSHVANTTYSTNYTYPINRKFTIEAGKATNLGLFLIQSRNTGTDANSNKYSIFLADNSREMTTFLRETKPKLYDSLTQKQLLLTPGHYFNRAQITSLRSYIASRKINSADWKREFGNNAYVTGPAGTMAHVIRDSAGAITKFQVLETNTLADLSACTSTPRHIACLISTTEYITVKDDKVALHNLPSGVVGNSLLAFSDTGLTVVDLSMNIYTSFDNGSTWKKSGIATLPLPIESKYKIADPKHEFSFYTTPNGHYISTQGTSLYFGYAKPVENHLVYMDYRTSTYHQILLPEPVKKYHQSYKANAGLYFLPEIVLFSPTQIYFLPKDKDTFEVRTLPQPGCDAPDFPDISGNWLQLKCRDRSGPQQFWESKNGGLKWSQIPQSSYLIK